MRAAATIVGGLFGCLALLLYGLFIERPFLTYENLPFPTQLQRVQAGEVMPLLVRRCNSSGQVRFYDVTHMLRSIDRPTDPPVVMVMQRVSIDPGCTEGPSDVNRVPLHTRPGHYYADGLGIVEGSIRTFAVPWTSQPFEVTP